MAGDEDEYVPHHYVCLHGHWTGVNHGFVPKRCPHCVNGQPCTSPVMTRVDAAGKRMGARANPKTRRE